MAIVNNQFEAFKTSLMNQISASGMTFDPAIDCRKDLINHYGYTLQQVSNMSDDEVFSIMDRMEDQEKGYTQETEYIPAELLGKKCKCGGKLNLAFVDCETRGDCEIYVFECSSCNDYTKLNYAAEWYDEY